MPTKRKKPNSRRGPRRSVRRAKEIVPGLYLREGTQDQMACLDLWTKQDIGDRADQLLGPRVKEMGTLIDMLWQWKKPRFAFIILNQLHAIVGDDRKHRPVNIPAMKKAFQQFATSVEKNGFGQVDIFHDFVSQLRKLKQIWERDLYMFLSSSKAYSLRPTRKDGDVTIVEPKIGHGKPSTLLRDQKIGSLVATFKTELSLTQAQAVRLALRFLSIVRCGQSEKSLRAIADRPLSNILIRPPSPALMTAKLNQVR